VKICPLNRRNPTLGDTVGEIAGFGYAAVLWTLLGYVVRGGSREVGTAPEPTLR
jgi:hypothetical protein